MVKEAIPRLFCREEGTKAWSKRLSPEDDDPSFIVLTETKFSFRCIPVWDRYSPQIENTIFHIPI